MVSSPESVAIHLLDRCIAQCAMCAFWRVRHRRDCAISIPQWEKFLASLQQAVKKRITVSLGGGEPMLYKEIFLLLRILRDLGFDANLTSNGYLINDVAGRGLARSGLRRLSLSLDSLDSGLHDRVRGISGLHGRALQAIRCVGELGGNIDIGIITVIMRKNLDEIVPLVRWVQENSDLKSISFQAVMQPFGELPLQGWHLRPQSRELWPQDAEKACAVIDEIVSLKRNGFDKIHNSYSQFEFFKGYFRDPDRFVSGNRICRVRGIYIGPDGQVFLCSKLDRIGTINDDFSDIWSSREAVEARKQISVCGHKARCHSFVNCEYEDAEEAIQGR